MYVFLFSTLTCSTLNSIIVRINSYFVCQSPGSSYSAQLVLTLHPSQPDASSCAPCGHAGPVAGADVRLGWGHGAARWRGAVKGPAPSVSWGQGPAFLAASCPQSPPHEGETHHTAGAERKCSKNNLIQMYSSLKKKNCTCGWYASFFIILFFSINQVFCKLISDL